MYIPFRFSLTLALLSLCAPLVGAQITDPRDIADCVLWLDGADVDGDFISGGDLVGGTTWMDKSTAGNAHAAQTAANRKPEVVAQVLNDLPVVRFDGSDFMDIDSAAFGMLNGVNGCTMFGLAKSTVRPAMGGQRVLMVSSGTNAAGTRAGLNIFDSFGTSLGGSGDLGLAGRRLDSDGFQRIEGGEAVLAEFVQWTGVFDYASATLKLYVEGVLVTEVTNFQTAGSTSATDSLNIRIGADAALNAVRGLFTGDIAELVAYDRVLADSDRQGVEDYLQDKWFAVPEPAPLTLTISADITGLVKDVTLVASGPPGDYSLVYSEDLASFANEMPVTIPPSGSTEIMLQFTSDRHFIRLQGVTAIP